VGCDAVSLGKWFSLNPDNLNPQEKEKNAITIYNLRHITFVTEWIN
jgi:hypothetical protein